MKGRFWANSRPLLVEPASVKIEKKLPFGDLCLLTSVEEGWEAKTVSAGIGRELAFRNEIRRPFMATTGH